MEMKQRKAITALVDEHDRALRHLLAMMNGWTDECLQIRVGEGELQTVREVLVHVLESICFSYFGWMQEKLEVSGFVTPPLERQQLRELADLKSWKNAIAQCAAYVEQATREIGDDDLDKRFAAYWNAEELYMIEQMFEHAIVHVWRHCRQLEKRLPVERVRRFVQAFDSGLQPIIFAVKTRTSEEAASVLGVRVGQIAKSILFRSEDAYGLFVAAGDVRVNLGIVKRLLGGKKPKMASPEEVVAVTGYQVGAVCPFALARDVPVYLDESMQRFDLLYTAAGTAESVLPISFDRLKQITGGTVINMEQ
jgi:prolyl-tRNA editing enzyme YbaK/EbsC (Cys-tRNA(Pro) deacylase)/uncharacterized damage-inducible protein DinB